MKSPIRSSKTAAPVTAAQHLPKNSGKMVLANVAYRATEKKTPAELFPESSSDRQVAKKMKQAAAQES